MKIEWNWGTGMALAYAVFATGTLAFVVFALRRPVDLVAPDYYAQALRQDVQMAAERNARELGGSASIVQTGDRGVLVSLPATEASARGTVTFYRASNAIADRVFDLKMDAAGRQPIALDSLAPGVWSVRVRWNAGGRDFYLEHRVFVR